MTPMTVMPFLALDPKRISLPSRLLAAPKNSAPALFVLETPLVWEGSVWGGGASFPLEGAGGVGGVGGDSPGAGGGLSAVESRVGSWSDLI